MSSPIENGREAAPETIEKEIRFAVVMYGGGSLAIYINGISQELLKMVRATGAKEADSRLKEDTEKVYRKIALLLSHSELSKEIEGIEKKWSESSKKEREEQRTQSSLEIKQVFEKYDQAQLRVKFIIDVLSGSSAGGINAVFLAKALANDHQIDRLKNLWLLEGDFAKLLNDKLSIADLDLISSPIIKLMTLRFRF